MTSSTPSPTLPPAPPPAGNAAPHRAAKRPEGPVRAFVSGWFGGFVLAAVVLLGARFVLASPIPGLLGAETPFDAFPARIEAASFRDAFDFLADCPYSKIDRLEKWTKPIKVRVEGLYDAEDLAVLESIVARFSSVKGFPGMSLVASGENVLVSYITMDSYAYYKKKYSASTTDESYCSHWASNGAYTKAGIVIRVDEGSHGYRNSVVLHEFFHLVGFQSHTTMRQSIVNAVGPVPSLSSVDLLAFRMLYDPAVKPLATLSQFEKAFEGKKASAYLVPSAPYERDDALPDLPLPAAALGALLLLALPASVKRLGAGAAFARLFAQLSGALLAAYLYWSFYPQFMDPLQAVLRTAF